MNRRECLVCGAALHGRSDKKFCSETCRSFENNKIKAQDKYGISEMNKVLRRNREILKTLCPYGHATVRKDVMDALGYQQCMFTSLFITDNRQVYYLCYDYGFTPLIVKGIKKVLIITRQAYMNSPDPWKYVKEKNSGKSETEI
jgi:hypothetical protein